jgi:hypothetical protein
MAKGASRRREPQKAQTEALQATAGTAPVPQPSQAPAPIAPERKDPEQKDSTDEAKPKGLLSLLKNSTDTILTAAFFGIVGWAILTVHEHAKLITSVQAQLEAENKKLESVEKTLDGATESLKSTTEQLIRIEERLWPRPDPQRVSGASVPDNSRGRK